MSHVLQAIAHGAVLIVSSAGPPPEALDVDQFHSHSLETQLTQALSCDAEGATSSLELMQRKGAVLTNAALNEDTNSNASQLDLSVADYQPGRETGTTCFLYSCPASLGRTECHHWRCICAQNYRWSKLTNRCESDSSAAVQRDTGGTCRIWWCSKWRGPTDCISGKCLCKDDWHAVAGVCMKNVQTTTTTTEAPGSKLMALSGKPPVMETMCSLPYQQCSGSGWTGPTCCERGYSCEMSGGQQLCVPVTSANNYPKYGFSEDLRQASTAPVLTFYMYRSQGVSSYPPEDVNLADLAGAMWYLHNEIVGRADWGYKRKFKITRMLRYKVQTRAPQPLFDLGMNFGVRMAFDSGQCTGPFDCNAAWQNYGYFVGCNKFGKKPSFPFPDFPTGYEGVWYSLPGKCPQMMYYNKANKSTGSHGPDCMMNQPGGVCDAQYEEPTGAADCTWRYEEAGEIDLDELVGIPKGKYDAWVESGNREYDRITDVGIGMTFWNNLNDTAKGKQRVAAAKALFDKKYPGSYEGIEEPPCDFDFDKFYLNAPGGHKEKARVNKCHDALPGEECYQQMTWAKSDGIYSHPDWYPGLTGQSSMAAFQKALWKSGGTACQEPCS
eukprot:TRINITY_DN64212_c0_g1_i1.p1 TRINITY_DN64212_c0_g1~~TRINITY_DN64212_c0_g1_i1.p1  ORF type:complete len:623 (+),score=92.07 TRINITY_DN64212_c0_g1_i1:45-1871(+)